MNLLTTEIRELLSQKKDLEEIADLFCGTTEEYFHYMNQVDIITFMIADLAKKQLKNELKIKEEMDKLEANG